MSYKVTFAPNNHYIHAWAHTLCPSVIGFNKESGWTVEGEVHEDYYEWVNDFVAKHPVYGYVKGNFETVVTAKSKKAYKHFIEYHPPEEWDYWDI